MNHQIQLLQFLVCKEFRQESQDLFTADKILTNIYTSKFPFYFGPLYVVTCWRKDSRFHKEVIEYATDYGTSVRSPHMDIEPAKDSVIFRWHTHRFPSDFSIGRPTVLTIRVILDWKTLLETYLLIEKTP